MKKYLARKIYLEKRRSLEIELFNRLEKETITNCIQLIKKLNPKVVHCYLPINNKQEIDTKLIFQYCWENNIETVIPISDFKNNTMASASYDNSTQLFKNKHEIPEPKKPIITNNEEIELVITPLIAFDKKGHRVGFGKGFYDRFFSTCNIKTRKVGLSLFEPINDIEDTSEHDISLNYVVNPKKIFTF